MVAAGRPRDAELAPAVERATDGRFEEEDKQEPASLERRRVDEDEDEGRGIDASELRIDGGESGTRGRFWEVDRFDVDRPVISIL